MAELDFSEEAAKVKIEMNLYLSLSSWVYLIVTSIAAIILSLVWCVNGSRRLAQSELAQL